MSDRELLELAAKAAGYEFRWGEVEQLGDDVVDCTDLTYIVDGASLIYWDPLGDDGDALRLAVKVGLRIEVLNRRLEPHTVAIAPGESLKEEEHRDDPLRATRRAIVRAAAAFQAPGATQEERNA